MMPDANISRQRRSYPSVSPTKILSKQAPREVVIVADGRSRAAFEPNKSSVNLPVPCRASPFRKREPAHKAGRTEYRHLSANGVRYQVRRLGRLVYPFATFARINEMQLDRKALRVTLSEFGNSLQYGQAAGPHPDDRCNGFLHICWSKPVSLW